VRRSDVAVSKPSLSQTIASDVIRVGGVAAARRRRGGGAAAESRLRHAQVAETMDAAVRYGACTQAAHDAAVRH
jgi:hypothetical protein